MDLPEDDPSLIARLLTFIYTSTYSTTNLTTVMAGVALEQFRGVPDRFREEPELDVKFAKSAIIHANMFAYADKYDVPELLIHAKKRFTTRFNNTPDPDEYVPETASKLDLNGEKSEVVSEDAEEEVYTPECALADDQVIRAVYALPELASHDLRMIVVEVTQRMILQGHPLRYPRMLTCMREVPDFAIDIAVLRLADAESSCPHCGVFYQFIFGRCRCGSVLGCKLEECRQRWREKSICPKCYEIGSIEYPELDE